MDLDKLHKELENLANTIKATIRASMEKYPNLSESNIYKELKSDAVGYDLIKVLIHDYYIYIENGRRSGSFPPPSAIAAWCKEIGIDDSNSTVYAICMSIYKGGIVARPFFDESWDEIDDLFDGFADRVMDILLEDIDAELS